MKKLFHGIVFGLLALSLNMGAMAAPDKGSAEEATALVKKAAAYMKANGKEKAFAEFNNPNGQFKDRDLYIAVLDMNSKVLAHGANAKLIDKNLIELKDVDGKYFVKGFVEVAGSKGKGWVDYKWPHPLTKAVEQKSSYGEKFDDMIFMGGIYK